MIQSRSVAQTLVHRVALNALLAVAALMSQTLLVRVSAAQPAVVRPFVAPQPGEKKPPAVFRSTLDGQPRMVSVGLDPELWVAYDASTCGIYRAWSGDVKFEGAVYTTVHGPQPTTRGEVYTRGTGQHAFRLKDPAGKELDAKPIYRGYTIGETSVSFTFEIPLKDKPPIVISETPGVQRIDDQFIMLRRSFSVTGVPKDFSVEVGIPTDFLSNPKQTLTINTLNVPPAIGNPAWLVIPCDLTTTAFYKFVKPSANQLKVLFYTRSAGFRHDVLPLAAQVFNQFNTDFNWIKVTHSDDPAFLTTDNLRRNNVLALYTTGDLGEQTRRDVLDWVRAGGALVGIHSATDTFNEHSDWTEMIGGIFESHPWNDRVSMVIDQTEHPVMKPFADAVQSVPGQPRRFAFADEIYQFKSFQPGSNVLLSLDPRTPGADPTRQYPLAWTREYGKGRVYYIALGHRDTTWKDGRFLDSIIAGIRWTARRDKE